MRPCGPRPSAFGDVFELRVSLRHIEPTIWRTLRVPADVPLGMLHEVLQTAFGWTNSHLHDFQVGDIRFGMTDIEDEMFSVDENAAPLGAVARRVQAPSTATTSATTGSTTSSSSAWPKAATSTIRCTGGARACPPEDCGGPPGYAHMLEVLANPKDEEHAEMKQWAPRGFDPRSSTLWR